MARLRAVAAKSTMARPLEPRRSYAAKAFPQRRSGTIRLPNERPLSLAVNHQSSSYSSDSSSDEEKRDKPSETTEERRQSVNSIAKEEFVKKAASEEDNPDDREKKRGDPEGSNLRDCADSISLISEPVNTDDEETAVCRRGRCRLAESSDGGVKESKRGGLRSTQQPAEDQVQSCLQNGTRQGRTLKDGRNCRHRATRSAVAPPRRSNKRRSDESVEMISRPHCRHHRSLDSRLSSSGRCHRAEALADVVRFLIDKLDELPCDCQNEDQKNERKHQRVEQDSRRYCREAPYPCHHHKCHARTAAPASRHCSGGSCSNHMTKRREEHPGSNQARRQQPGREEFNVHPNQQQRNRSPIVSNSCTYGPVRRHSQY